MQLSYPINPAKRSAKILLLTSGTAMYLLFELYSADLTTEMTTGPGMHPVRNFDDVIKGDYKVIVKGGTAQFNEMTNSMPGTAKHRYYHDKMKDNDAAIVNGLDEALEMMNEDAKMLFFYTLTARFITDELKFINTQGSSSQYQLRDQVTISIQIFMV